ncbi:hypothetical protein [Thermococcus thioreducens]|uniref:Uncharacterized protein n=1 Tax=Thermococcus thioreducens TaxID=277988 RepID=A0A0Q2XPM7_9EURY|nr:hypothetical protein [Thermococcus thioreducens]ASJ13357.1 hypothetical protein A3L14_10915 [Thermococcus thioreducens]KQH83236.1 hypothetical protein AMR53_00695 [Thermococcus thioreducens]SEW23140.1 hypothetical protein SAMN05216170_2288 [Thermococcus thioreducens]
MRWKKPLGLFVALVLVFSVFAVVRAATITNVTWENAITDPGIELIAGTNATLNVTILTSSGDPFALSSYTNADLLEVTAKFVDEYGNALDMNGDNNADIYTLTNTSTPGLWTGTISIGNVTPGEYTLKIEALAKNSTTNTIVDNATMELSVWIAGGPYWVSVADVKDGDTIEIGNLQFTIRGLSELGAILDLGNLTTQTITDSDRDGFFTWQYDVTNDGANDWIVFTKSNDDSDRYILMIYSSDANLLDSFNLTGDFEVRSSDGRITFRNKVFKNYNTYKAYVVWDESWLAKLGIKAVDYYIIPLRGREHWREGMGNVERTDIKVIKRTTYAWGLFGSEEEVYSGNIFNKKVNVDNVLTVFGKWVGNWAYFARGLWEIRTGLGDITIPNTYSLRERNLNELSVSSEDFRGFNPVLQPEGRGFFKPNLDWANLLGLEDEESSSS